MERSYDQEKRLTMWERETSKPKTLTKPKLKEERDKENFWNTWRPTNRNNVESTMGMEDSRRIERMDETKPEKPTSVQNVRTSFIENDNMEAKS